MRPFRSRDISSRIRRAGANTVTLLLALAVPPQAANAVLYLTADATSPDSGLWRRLRVMISDHVGHLRHKNRSSKQA